MADKKNKKQLPKKKTYVNPTEKLWGKIVIWALVVAMVGTIIVGAIITIIEYFG